jgi:HTH-type transcriptional regulator/antitoxin MqsA
MTETRIHPETGKTLRRGIRPQTVSFGSMTRVVDVPGWYPDDDSDSMHSGSDLFESDRVFQELRADYAAHVRKVRKRLRLTQEEAGELIGGGRRAFQKYESGAMPPSDAAVGLIEVLDRHPEEVEFLRSIRSPAPSGIGGGRVGPRARHRRRTGVDHRPSETLSNRAPSD